MVYKLVTKIIVTVAITFYALIKYSKIIWYQLFYEIMQTELYKMQIKRFQSKIDFVYFISTNHFDFEIIGQ